MYLPFIPGDDNEAASALLALELALPVRGARRARVPLFVLDDTFAPLTCDLADRLFAALAKAALGPKRAAELTFHSCRIWAACALLALDQNNPTIQAAAREATASSDA